MSIFNSKNIHDRILYQFDSICVKLANDFYNLMQIFLPYYFSIKEKLKYNSNYGYGINLTTVQQTSQLFIRYNVCICTIRFILRIINTARQWPGSIAKETHCTNFWLSSFSINAEDWILHWLTGLYHLIKKSDPAAAAVSPFPCKGAIIYWKNADEDRIV